MERIKVLFSLCVFFTFLSMGAFGALASDQITYTGPPIELRISYPMGSTHAVFKAGFKPSFELIEKESKGKLVFKYYLSRSLHGHKEGFTAVRTDITDITMAFPSYQAKTFHLANGLPLPFAFPNARVAGLVAEELYPKYLKKEFAKIGVDLAYYMLTSGYNLLSKKPIRKLEDMKGLKVRSAGGALGEIVKRLGGVPVLISATEIYQSLQRGIVDAVIFYDGGLLSYRAYEIAKYLTELNISNLGCPMILNPKTFNKLPKDLKRLFYNGCRRGSQVSENGYETVDETAVDIMKKSGVEVITLSPEEFDRWRAAVEPIWADFITKNEALGLPAKEFVKDLRRLSKKYSTWTPDQFMKQVTEHPVQGIIDF